MMTHDDVLQALLPAGAYDPNGLNLGIELAAEGAVLDAVKVSADSILAEMSPATCQISLIDWERNYGLPDQCVSVAQTVDQRRVALQSKVAAVGGQGAGYYIAVAAALGYSGVTITEFNVLTCNGDCNSAIYGQDALFVWEMGIPLSAGVLQASCNSDCDTALQSWGDGALECRINKIKPKHTTVIFSYI
jgi:uncharacterized protein YmfQ (DUF2313 family)